MSQIKNRPDLLREWSNKTGLTQKELKPLYESLEEVILDSIDDEEETTTLLPGIGKIKVYPTLQRIGFDPYNMRKVLVPAKRRIKIQPLPSLVKKIEG